MTTFINRTFRGGVVPLDGNRFEGCLFIGVRLQFLGEAPFSITSDCRLDAETHYYFADRADMVLTMIAGLIKEPSIQQLLREAREKVTPPPPDPDD